MSNTSLVTTRKVYTPLNALEIQSFGHNKLIDEMLFSLSVVWRITLNGETNCISSYTKKEVIALIHKDLRPLVAASWDKDGNLSFNKRKMIDVCHDLGLLYQKTSFSEFVEVMLSKSPAAKVVKEKAAPKAWTDKAVEGQIDRIRNMDDENIIAMQKQLAKLQVLLADELTNNRVPATLSEPTF
jgi:hypothetical protein